MGKMKLKRLTALLLSISTLVGSLATSYVSAFATDTTDSTSTSTSTSSTDTSMGTLDSNDIRKIYISMMKGKTTSDLAKEGVNSLSEDDLRPLALFLSNYYIPMNSMLCDSSPSDTKTSDSSSSSSDNTTSEDQAKSAKTDTSGYKTAMKATCKTLGMADDTADTVVSAVVNQNIKTSRKLYISSSDAKKMLKFIEAEESGSNFQHSYQLAYNTEGIFKNIIANHTKNNNVELTYYIFWTILQMYPIYHQSIDGAPGSKYVHQLGKRSKAIKVYWLDDSKKKHTSIYINQEFVEQFVAYFRNLNSGTGENIALSIYPATYFSSDRNAKAGNDAGAYIKSLYTECQLYVDWVGDIVMKRGGKDNVVVMPACGNPSAMTTLNHNKDNINMLNLFNLYSLSQGAWYVSRYWRTIEVKKKNNGEESTDSDDSSDSKDKICLQRHAVAVSMLNDAQVAKTDGPSKAANNKNANVFGNAFDYTLHKEAMRLAYNCEDCNTNIYGDLKTGPSGGNTWGKDHDLIRKAIAASNVGYTWDELGINYKLVSKNTGLGRYMSGGYHNQIPFPNFTFENDWKDQLCASWGESTKFSTFGVGAPTFFLNEITDKQKNVQIKYNDKCDDRWKADGAPKRWFTYLGDKYDMSTALQYVVMWDQDLGNWADGEDFFYQGSVLDPEGSKGLTTINDDTHKKQNGASGSDHKIVSAYTTLNVDKLAYDVDENDLLTTKGTYAKITGSDDLLKHLFVTYVFAYWDGKTFGQDDRSAWGNGSAYRSKTASHQDVKPVVDLCFDNWLFPAADGELDLTADEINNIPNHVVSMAYWFLHPSKGINYVATWFKNKVGGIFLRMHEDIVGASDSNYTTGIVKYLGVSSFTSTPNLHDMSWTSALLNNYNTFVIYLLIIIVVVMIAQILCGRLSPTRALVGFGCFVVLVFLPPLAINGVTDLSNVFSDRIYSKKFDYWAVTQLESYMEKTTNSDDYMSTNGTADAVDMQQVDNSSSIAGEDANRYADVKVKWMSPKKFQYGIITQKALGKTTVANASTFMTSLVENTINSTISMESYVDDGGSALYVYRDYADIYKYASVSANLLTNYNLGGKITASVGTDDEKDAATSHFSIGQGGDINSVINNWSAKYQLTSYDVAEKHDIDDDNSITRLSNNATFGDNDINALDYVGLVNRIQRKPMNTGEQARVRQINRELGNRGDSDENLAVSGVFTNVSAALNSFQEAVLANHQDSVDNNPIAPALGAAKSIVNTTTLQSKIDTAGTWLHDTSSINAVRLGFLTDNNGIYNTIKDSDTAKADYYGVHTSATSLPLNFVATYGKILEKEQALRNTIDAGSSAGTSEDWALDISDFTSSNSKSFFGLPNTSFFMTVNDIIAINSEGVTPGDKDNKNSSGYKPTDFYKIDTSSADYDTTSSQYDYLLGTGYDKIKNYQALYGDLSDYYYALYSESPFYFLSANVQDQLSGSFGQMLGSTYHYTSDPSVTSASKLDSMGNLIKMLTNKNQAYFYNTVVSSTTPSSSASTSTSSDGSTDTSMNGDTAATQDTTSGDTNVNINGYGEMRDYMNMHDLFYYIIPLLKQGNDLVEMWGNNYGLNVYTDDSLEVHNDGSFTYDGKKYGTVKEGTQRPSDALQDFAPVYKKLSKERQYKFWHDYNTYYILTNCYTPWIDAMYDCKFAKEQTIKVAGKDFVVEDPLNPYTYFVSDRNGNIVEGRPMIFSRSEMEYYGLKEYNLTTVEKKILEMEDNVYQSTIRLTNYAGFSDENLINAFAMLELFEFNKEFSQSSATANYTQYPQGWELKAFSYDAYMRLVLAEASGEPLNYTDTTYDKINGVGKSIYARIQANTSIFFSILLVINDVLTVYVIPLLKLFMIVILFICSILMLMGAAVGLETEFHNLLWKCLIKPLLCFLLCNVGMAWIFSLFMADGLNSVTDTGDIIVNLQDPTMTIIGLTLLDVLVTVLFFMICKNSIISSWTFVKNIALETAGAIAGAVEKVTHAISGYAKSKTGSVRSAATGAIVTGTMSARGKRAVSKSGGIFRASTRNPRWGSKGAQNASSNSGNGVFANAKKPKSTPDVKNNTVNTKKTMLNSFKKATTTLKKDREMVKAKQMSAKNSSVKAANIQAKKKVEGNKFSFFNNKNNKSSHNSRFNFKESRAYNTAVNTKKKFVSDAKNTASYKSALSNNSFMKNKTANRVTNESNIQNFRSNRRRNNTNNVKNVSYKTFNRKKR